MMKDEAIVEALYLKGGGHTSCGVQGKIDQLVASTKDFITQIRMGCSWVSEKQIIRAQQRHREWGERTRDGCLKDQWGGVFVEGLIVVQER